MNKMMVLFGLELRDAVIKDVVLPNLSKNWRLLWLRIGTQARHFC